ncbi:hypothetical protein ACNFIA_29560 [Pseudomonas sp. NY15437]|uniref:hypothetical protein n=1 Tax=Pseudomonas sp. NY15437 TaxID=3400360 RepID=UPI003A8BDB48
MIKNVIIFIVKCFFICVILLFLAMIVGTYVSAAAKGSDIVFYDVVVKSAKDSIRGGAIMSTVALLLMLKNYVFRAKK